MKDQARYARRRSELIRYLKEGCIAIIPAVSQPSNEGGGYHPFRQAPDFYYLTGFEEPDALAVLVPGRAEGEYILFCHRSDPQATLWTGDRTGPTNACKFLGADQAFPLEEIDKRLPELMANQKTLYFPMTRDKAFEQRVMEWVQGIQTQIRGGVNAPSVLMNIESPVHEMRLRKDHDEIALIRRAGEIAAAGHRRAIRACRPGLYEYELEAELLYEFTRLGCRQPAYESVVAGGANACVLHYSSNSSPLSDGDLILIDAAGSYEGYAADVTRTFPVNGRFSKDQRALYEVVLAAQTAVIEMIKPGVSWNALEETAQRIITDGLHKLGILKGQPKKLLIDRAFSGFYMHRIGHWMGLNVHDVGAYKVDDQWRVLEPGMVFTVEPGIYISGRVHKDIDRRWRNIGIRIEDNIVVTHDGCDMLTADVPKTIDEIEALMAT